MRYIVIVILLLACVAVADLYTSPHVNYSEPLHVIVDGDTLRTFDSRQSVVDSQYEWLIDLELRVRALEERDK